MTTDEPIAAPRRAEMAYRHLLEFIESGQLGADGRLPSEIEFVERLGLSRASVREALARLRAEGRATSRRGAGTYATVGRPPELVRLSSIATVRDLIDWHEFRVALETETAGLAADRRTDQELVQLRHAQATLMDKLKRERAGREDAAFHRAISAASKNPKLEDAVGALTSHIFEWNRFTHDRGILTLGERREIIDIEHGEIVAAIADGDAERARAAMRRHLLNGRARLLSAIRT